MKTVLGVMLAMLTVPAFCGAKSAFSVMHGTVDRVESTGVAMVIRTTEGQDYTVYAEETTAVYGFEGKERTGKSAFKDVVAGSEVIAHYSVEGARHGAIAIRKVGDGGLRAIKGTVATVGHSGKTIGLRTADGTVHTYTVAEHATMASAKVVTEGAKVIVYSAETGGEKVAHFLRLI